MTNFEKVLKEKLSAETFTLISSDEKVFGKWVENLKESKVQTMIQFSDCLAA